MVDPYLIDDDVTHADVTGKGRLDARQTAIAHSLLPTTQRGSKLMDLTFRDVMPTSQKGSKPMDLTFRDVIQEARRLEVLQRRQQRELEQMINYEKKRQVKRAAAATAAARVSGFRLFDAHVLRHYWLST